MQSDEQGYDGHRDDHRACGELGVVVVDAAEVSHPLQADGHGIVGLVVAEQHGGEDVIGPRAQEIGQHGVDGDTLYIRKKVRRLKIYCVVKFGNVLTEKGKIASMV